MNITGIEILKKEPDFLGIKWVLKAVGKKTNRFLLQNIIFDSGKWVATDGTRMHVYESQESFKKGLYESVVNNNRELILKFISDDVNKYPDWQNTPLSSKTPLELKVDWPLYPSVVYSNIIRCLEVSATLNFQFVDDLLRSSFNEWTAYIYNKADAVWFVSERKIGIIMPMHC